MAVRSCAVGVATTPQESSKSPSASASSNGAVQWSVRTARKLWTYIHAKPPSEQSGWIRPEDDNPSAPCNGTPTLFPLQDILWNTAFWKSLSKSALRLRPLLLPPCVVIAWLFYLSVKAVESSTHQYELILISPSLWMSPWLNWWDKMNSDTSDTTYHKPSPDGLLLCLVQDFKWFAAFMML